MPAGPPFDPPRDLSGPVDVCVAVPKLSLDRPFTYLLPEGAGAGVGSLVSVPFHGRTVRGWVLGEAERPPTGRLLSVRKVRSPVRFFDERSLRLLRWIGERYLAPLSVVIERSHPPRVAGVEKEAGPPAAPPAATRGPSVRGWLDPRTLLDPGAVTWVRPLPGEEASACVGAVAACLEAGRRAIVLVPEAHPVPDTARRVLEAFGDRAISFVGGGDRDRYRTWLSIRAGRHDVVVGTRPAVLAPLPGLGLVWVSREAHPGHREERAPYYHVRDVAVARAAIEGAAVALASYSPSVETAVAAESGAFRVARPPRAVERRAVPLVETVPVEAEDRTARLGRLVRETRSAALIVSRAGYGLARVCRGCRAEAACATCGGPIGAEGGRTVCRSCGAPGRCASCGSTSFGLERGGVERVVEWAARLAHVPVAPAAANGEAEEGERTSDAGPPPESAPGPGRVLVGTAAAVNDVGAVGLDLVAILDPDRALARPGLHAGERALATWMEAAAWARPRERGGRVLVQTRRPGHPAVQALVRWEPVPFLLAEGRSRSEAGLPPGNPVFRLTGTIGPGEQDRLRAAGAVLALVTTVPAGTVCLVAVRPGSLAGFRQTVLELVDEGVVTRVEAEPDL